MRIKVLLSISCISLFFIACKKKENSVERKFPDISSNLVAYFPLDSIAFDTIGKQSGIVIKAAPTFDHRGNKNKAFAFSASDSAYIDFGNISSLSFPDHIFTMCCWINVKDTLSNMAVFSKRGVTGPWEYSLDNHFNKGALKLDNWVPGGNATVYGIDPLDASALLYPGQWHHIAVVADGNTLIFYEDGIVQKGVDLKQTGSSFEPTNGSFVIGNGGGYNKNYYFNGSIDELRFYSRALDADAIKLLFQQ